MNGYSPFQWFVKTTLPKVYDSSLSYYELLEKVIENLDGMGADVNELINLYNQTENDLIKGLEKKLDSMAQDGTLAGLLGQLFIPTTLAYSLGMTDGSDITTKLQNALNNGILDITFPAGTFYLSGVVELPTGTRIRAQKNTVFVRKGADLYMFLNGVRGKTDYAGGQSANGNIKILGGIYDINSTGNKSLSTTDNMGAFYFGAGDDIEIGHFEVRNGQNGHYFQISGCTNVHIHDFVCKNQYWTDTTNSSHESIQVELLNSDSFPYFKQTGNPTTVSENVLVERGYFENVIRAIGHHSYVLDSANLPIQSNNVIFRELRGFNIQDCAITMYDYKNFEVSNCNFDTVGGHAILTQYSDKGYIHHNNFKNVVKSGITLTNTNRCDVTKNTLKDVGTSNVGAGYSAIRVTTYSNKNRIQYNHMVNTSGGKYAYPMYFSDSVGNIVGGNEYDMGVGKAISGDINAPSSADLQNQQWDGGYDVVLYDGELKTVGQQADLPNNLATFKEIIVMGNANSSDFGALTQTFVIPNKLLILGSAVSRYRIFNTITNDYTEFHFDAYTNSEGLGKHRITIDTNTGNSRIRKIIGIR